MFDDFEVEQTMASANPAQDFAAALALFPLTALVRLERALDAGGLIRSIYASGEKKCLFGWLAGWTSRAECLAYAYPNKEAFYAVRRTIRLFDRGKLDADTIREVLAAAIAERKQLNAEENANVARVRRRLQQQSTAV